MRGGAAGGLQSPAGKGRAAKECRDSRELRTGAVATGNRWQEKGPAKAGAGQGQQQDGRSLGDTAGTMRVPRGVAPCGP